MGSVMSVSATDAECSLSLSLLCVVVEAGRAFTRWLRNNGAELDRVVVAPSEDVGGYGIIVERMLAVRLQLHDDAVTHSLTVRPCLACEYRKARPSSRSPSP